MEWYILDDDGNPVLCPNWPDGARWLDDHDDPRQIAFNDFGERGEVSTVFPGLNHRHGTGPPLVFETMVFGGPLDGQQRLYSTRAEALAGHADMVSAVTNAR